VTILSPAPTKTPKQQQNKTPSQIEKKTPTDLIKSNHISLRIELKTN